MAYKIRDSAFSSKGIEEVFHLTGKDRILQFVEKNRMGIFGGVAVLCLVGVIIGLVIWQAQKNREHALVLEGKAQQLYLDRSLDEPEKTKENIEKATEIYQQIFEEYPRTVSAQTSMYFLGNARFEQEDFNGAIEAYENFLDQYDSPEVLKGLVYQRIGYAYLLKGEKEKAFDAFSTVLKIPGAMNQDQVLMEFGKLEEAEGASEKALIHYTTLVEQFPISPFASEAALRIKVLSPEKDDSSSEEEKTLEESKSPAEDSKAPARENLEEEGN